MDGHRHLLTEPFHLLWAAKWQLLMLILFSVIVLSSMPVLATAIYKNIPSSDALKTLELNDFLIWLEIISIGSLIVLLSVLLKILYHTFFNTILSQPNLLRSWWKQFINIFATYLVLHIMSIFALNSLATQFNLDSIFSQIWRTQNVTHIAQQNTEDSSIIRQFEIKRVEPTFKRSVHETYLVINFLPPAHISGKLILVFVLLIIASLTGLCLPNSVTRSKTPIGRFIIESGRQSLWIILRLAPVLITSLILTEFVKSIANMNYILSKFYVYEVLQFVIYLIAIAYYVSITSRAYLLAMGKNQH